MNVKTKLRLIVSVSGTTDIGGVSWVKIYGLARRSFWCPSPRLRLREHGPVTQHVTRLQPIIELTAGLASTRLPEQISLMLDLSFGRLR